MAAESTMGWIPHALRSSLAAMAESISKQECWSGGPTHQVFAAVVAWLVVPVGLVLVCARYSCVTSCSWFVWPSSFWVHITFDLLWLIENSVIAVGSLCKPCGWFAYSSQVYIFLALKSAVSVGGYMWNAPHGGA